MEHVESTFAGYGRLRLFHQSWQDGLVKAVLLVIPGLAEHGGRYVNLVNHFVPKGFAVCAIDHRGHGRSEGRRAYVGRFDYFLDDIKTWFDIVRCGYPGRKVFLVGHSMGGTLATIFTARHQADIGGLVISAGTVVPGDSVTPAMTLMAKVLSKVMPTAGVSAIPLEAISCHRALTDAYTNDPLVFRGKITARLAAEILAALRKLPSSAAEIRLPALLLQGTDDLLSNPRGSELLYRWLGSKDKTLKTYSGFCHEVFNEPGHERVMSDLEEWLEARLQGGMHGAR